MKFLTAITVTVAMLFFASCQREANEILVDEENISSQRKFIVKYKIYDTAGAVSNELYTLYIVDSAAHTIYNVVDTLADVYESRHFDVNGRLEKVVYNNTDVALPSRDSIMITRSGTSGISWNYSPGFGAVSTTAFITLLPGGRKHISITEAGQDPNKTNEVYLNAAGTLDSFVLANPATASNYAEVHRTRVVYDVDGKPVTVIRTLHQPTVVFTFTSTEQLTKDTRDNEYLNTFLDKLCGSDLAWINYIYTNALGPGSIIPYIIGNKIGLLKGTVQSIAIDQQSVYNGLVIDSDSGLYEHPTQYDASGRIISWQEKVDGKLLISLDIEYFD